MNQTAHTFEGVLTEGQGCVPVRARYASRYSLWIEGNGAPVEEVGNMALVVSGETVNLGRCRIVPDAQPAGREDNGWQRLVPVEQMHDFEKLLFHSKSETLQHASEMNIPLILGYKDSIDQDFRHFVSDLTYDLSVYGTLFDQMDSEYHDEPPAISRAIQESIIGTTGRSLRDYMERQQHELSRIVSGFREDEHEHHGFYFRRQLWNTLLRAPIMARTNLKPRGYNGDSEMMRMVYLNDHQGDSTFGKILHKYSTDQAAAQAVRNRRQDVAKILHEYAGAHPPKGSERLRVLSVACGPCSELWGILRSAEDCARLHFSLFDQDQQALLEAAGLITEIEETRGAAVSVDFIRESVRTMLVTRVLQDRWGRFNFIYSMGLFDYLTFPVAVAVLRKLYQLLTPGGEIVIGNFFVANESRIYMEYWHDWKIIHRSEEELLRMADGLPGARAQLHFDATGIQMLLRIDKGESDGG